MKTRCKGEGGRTSIYVALAIQHKMPKQDSEQSTLGSLEIWPSYLSRNLAELVRWPLTKAIYHGCRSKLLSQTSCGTLCKRRLDK